jgi:hypothetical protein
MCDVDAQFELGASHSLAAGDGFQCDGRLHDPLVVVLSDYYPYWGELSDSAFDKALGKQLKTGGAGRLTSVVDGHPILAGDLLAFGLLLTMPLARGQRSYLGSWVCYYIRI